MICTIPLVINKSRTVVHWQFKLYKVVR